MPHCFTSYGKPDDATQVVDHLELAFKPMRRLAQIAEYVEHKKEIPEPFRNKIRRMALDRPTIDGIFAFSDLLEIARQGAAEIDDDTWRKLNPEKAAEVDALTAEDREGRDAADGTEAAATGEIPQLDDRVGQLRDGLEDASEEARTLARRGELPQDVRDLLRLSRQAAEMAHDGIARARRDRGDVA